MLMQKETIQYKPVPLKELTSAILYVSSMKKLQWNATSFAECYTRCCLQLNIITQKNNLTLNPAYFLVAIFSLQFLLILMNGQVEYSGDQICEKFLNVYTF